MATNVEWPTASDEPYRVTVETDSSQAAKPETEDADNEFRRFEDMTRNLLRVSKSELDEQLKGQ